MVAQVLALVRTYDPELPSSVRVLQAGVALNAFGNGAVNPFLVVYLHDVRGIPLGVAGLAGSVGAASGLFAALGAGTVADRRGSRGTLITGLVLSTVGFALYPLVREPWQALALAVLLGCGVGTWLTMQSSLLSELAPPERRHAAFARQRVLANVGLGLGGFAGGAIVTTSRPSTFTVLFLLNAVTFLGYGLILLRLPRTERTPADESSRQGYAGVLRDPAFRRVLGLNLLFVAGTIALVNSLVPVFAVNEAGVSEHEIGVLFLLNSAVIVVFQLPVARALEGHRRMRSLALMAVLFACCWSLVLVTGSVLHATAAVVLLAVAFIVLSIGECIYDSVQGPLTADLAPPGLRGRYMAALGFSWQLGFIVGPGVGGFLLATSPAALWGTAIALCLAGAAVALATERTIPSESRVTPVPRR